MDVLVLIDKLDDLVHQAKAVPLTDQVRIDREEIWEILDQMRATIPEEIKQARWIVKERQEMLARPSGGRAPRPEAREKAAARGVAAGDREQAERQAASRSRVGPPREREVRLGAEDYADQILSTLEANLGKFLSAVSVGASSSRRPAQESANQREKGRHRDQHAVGAVFNLRSIRLSAGGQNRQMLPVTIASFTVGGEPSTPSRR